MKKYLIITEMVLVMTILANIFMLQRLKSLENIVASIPSVQAEEPTPEADKGDWETFILALAWTESKWDTKAVGKADDVGWLQITPVIIRDANRIVGSEKYKLSDRTSKAKSVEIFNVVQDKYNPDHDYNLAMKVWNPRAPLAYHRLTMKKFDELKNI